jgi:hypothetical protein
MNGIADFIKALNGLQPTPEAIIAVVILLAASVGALLIVRGAVSA